MSALHLGEAGKNGAHAEAGGFAAVNAREEWVGEAIDHLRAVVALDERSDAFVGIGGTRGMKQFLRHAELGGPGKKRRESCGQDFGWDHEHQAVGHGDEAAADEDVGYAIGVVGADELIAEAEGAAEIGGPGLFGDEGIGPGFDDAATMCSVRRTPPRLRRGFIEDVFDCAGAAMFFESESGGESGDAAADDRDANHECGLWETPNSVGCEYS